MRTNKSSKSGHPAASLQANAAKKNIESQKFRGVKKRPNHLKTGPGKGAGGKRRGTGAQDRSGSGVMDAISLYFFSHPFSTPANFTIQLLASVNLSFYYLTFNEHLIQVNRLKTDSVIFRLHGLTAALLLIFSITISTRQTVGNPIDCDHTREIPVNVFNAFCWVHSTYFITAAMLGLSGINVAYPGVGPSRHHHPQAENSNAVKHVKYYQWVAFTLFFQAILFYTPRWLWKGWEGGKIHALMMDLDIGICSEVEKKQKKKLLLDYLWENLRYHNWWAYRYYLCEVLALINVIGQMFLMNRFFDGAFLTFGIDVLRFLESDQEDRVDPMIFVFPRMTKCTFYKYGVGGEVEKHDAVCILPLNVVNEKIYVFLWFWFLILGVLSFMTVVYRIVIIFSPRMRVYLLRLRFRLVRREAVETIVRRSKMGDWFLLYMLGENLDTVIYRDVMHDLANKLASRHHHSVPGVKGELQEA